MYYTKYLYLGGTGFKGKDKVKISLTTGVFIKDEDMSIHYILSLMFRKKEKKTSQKGGISCLTQPLTDYTSHHILFLFFLFLFLAVPSSVLDCIFSTTHRLIPDQHQR